MVPVTSGLPSKLFGRSGWNNRTYNRPTIAPFAEIQGRKWNVIVAGKDQIQGWKEIAAFLGLDEASARKWEAERGLPVRRIPDSRRAEVYMLVSELEAWIAATNTSNLHSSVEAAELLPAAIGTNPASAPNAAGHLPRAAAPQHLEPSRFQQLQASLVVFILALGLTAAILICCRIASRHPIQDAAAPPAAAAAAPPVHVTRAPVAGVDQLYLQGIFFFEERTSASLEHAREIFEQAIAKDPDFAPAYAGLANTYLLLREYSLMPEAEAYTRARVAATHAISLDPNLSDPHASLGFIDFFFSWNAAAARDEFHTAINLNPNSALAHHWYGSMLTHQGLYTEALEQLDVAQRLQPTSSAILAIRARALALSGRRNEAVDMLETLVSTHRDAAPPHHALASLSLIEPRDMPRYLDEARYFSTLRNDRETLAVLSASSVAFRRSGEPGFWAAVLAKERKLHPSAEHPTFFMAEAEAALGQNDQALDDLTLLLRQHDPSVIGISVDPSFSGLRSNPRFQQMLAELGLHTPTIQVLNPQPAS